MPAASRAHFILYVRDQQASRRFWEAALATSPTLDVPGMTEFPLAEGAVLGLMPVAGIRRLLPSLPDPTPEVPRAEVYLMVDDVAAAYARALAAGARSLSGPAVRDWGHEAAYALDPDGHVVAFARSA